ncbi:MAG TPA: hypothetical protein VIO61_10385 [Anaerolineaceae bacterium]
MNPLSGKGFWIWKIKDCENGNPASIASVAQAAGFTHVPIKIADGTDISNFDVTNRVDLIPPVVQTLKAKGIQVWGWHYVYGDDPIGEARLAVQRIKQYDLSGYIIDAEQEYKLPGREVNARRFMSEIRAGLPNLPVALSSYRFPVYHQELPWTAFLEKCDLNMPQVYWEQAHNPAEQLERSVRELTALTPSLPVIPTGPGYKWSGWRPTELDIVEFINKARELGLSAINLFSWDECRRDLMNIWNVFAGYAWDAPKDPVLQLFAAINARDPILAAGVYKTGAILITPYTTLQGTNEISSYYTGLLNQTLPSATFSLVGSPGEGSFRQINWTANSSRGKVLNGSDSLAIQDGKIAYHFTSYTLT